MKLKARRAAKDTVHSMHIYLKMLWPGFSIHFGDADISLMTSSPDSLANIFPLYYNMSFYSGPIFTVCILQSPQ